MFKKCVILFSCMLLCCVAAKAQQKDSAKQTTDQETLTKYEKFFKRDGVLTFSKYYHVGNVNGVPFDVSANVGWTQAPSEKVYAAKINGNIVDFEQLSLLIDDFDKMIRAVEVTFDQADATSMSYSSPIGLRMSYSVYPDSTGNPKKNLYVMFRSGFVTQGPDTDKLKEMRNLIIQAREKLVSLGAK